MASVLIFSCKKEQPDLPLLQDPCECASEVSADFTIKEKLIAPWPDEHYDTIYTLTDNIIEGKNVFFSAIEPDADYTWYIGAETLHVETFGRLMNTGGADVDVSLVVRKEPNLNCFPNDDGYDSITKTIQVFDRCDTLLMEGYFRVAEQGTTDSIDIGFNITEPLIQPDGNCIMLEVFNYDGLGTDCTVANNSSSSGVFVSYRCFFTNGVIYNCDRVNFKANLHLDGRFELWRTIDENTYIYNPNSTSLTKFYGRKL